VGECFGQGTATFLILGNTCSRGCRYCAVPRGEATPPDYDEPRRVGRAVAELSLRHAVITSVTRDDIPDGGAEVFAMTAREIRNHAPGCTVELLVPDFRRSLDRSLAVIIESRPDVINHNIEVVRGLFPALRPGGDYDASIGLIARAAESGIPVKSGLMIGFGESMDDIAATLKDLRAAGCAVLTVGQYLRSSREGYPVAKYYRPEEFEDIRERALSMGFLKVLSGAMVRSSYHAREILR
jgi:lipoic acid synthetase